jgi:Ca-activated chloride channel family protein
MRIRSLLVLFAVFVLAITPQQTVAASPAGTSGSLSIVDKGGKISGECPLKHTDVSAAISGSFARVTVTQSFANSATDTIEAVYTFPLPHDAAVDDMTIHVGDRTIHGVIQTREQAQKIYEHAIQQQQTAALLDQERPNIFTQRVGNILPGAAVDVAISYVAPLQYEEGTYEFAFPMVVGPRYIPGKIAIGVTGTGTVPDTNRVPDASKITPPVSPTRAGHDISITVAIDAGVPIQNLRSTTHVVNVTQTGANEATVRLRDESTIPNKDFVLRYDVAGSQITEGLLTHTRTPGDGYFSLIIQPPSRFHESDVTPKEIVFVLDSSGSMSGFPIERAKQFIDTALDGLYSGDTFNVIKFSGETAILFDQPVYPTAENVEKARQFTNIQWGGGGTEMMKAIRAALDPSDSQDHLRIVVFLTDGYVGNDLEILGEIRKHPKARVFAYGIGTSVNRFLISGMGHEGRGDAEIITSVMKKDEVDSATKRFYEHLRSPLLTDISLDFGTLPVSDIYPTHIADLFSGRPVLLSGRYLRGTKGVVTLKAKRAGDNYVREIPVEFATSNSGNNVLPSLWARAKIEDLMAQDLAGLQQQRMNAALQKQITDLGLNYRLMTQFTSFVAVEEQVRVEGGKARTVEVPVELPEGVRYEEQWGAHDRLVAIPMATQSVVVSRGLSGVVRHQMALAPPPPPPMNGPASNNMGSGPGVGIGAAHGAGIGPGSGGGIGGRVYRVGPNAALKPDSDGAVPPTPGLTYKSKDEALLATKSDAKLLAAYQCWNGRADKGATDSTCQTKNGVVKVDVILEGEWSSLAALGFAPEGQAARKRLRGTIAIEKLPSLAALKVVRFMSLHE